MLVSHVSKRIVGIVFDMCPLGKHPFPNEILAQRIKFHQLRQEGLHKNFRGRVLRKLTL